METDTSKWELQKNGKSWYELVSNPGTDSYRGIATLHADVSKSTRALLVNAQNLQSALSKLIDATYTHHRLKGNHLGTETSSALANAIHILQQSKGYT